MSINTIVYSWKRSLPGREHLSARHFEEFTNYLAGLQKDGQIQSFDTVMLEPNGSNVNGFFLIKGEDAQLGRMLDSQAWSDHMVRSLMHLDEPMLAYGVCGPQVKERMARWVAAIPT